MSTVPDLSRPCVTTLTLPTQRCRHTAEHPNQTPCYAVGETPAGVHWSLLWWNVQDRAERPEESASAHLRDTESATAVVLERAQVESLLEQAHTAGARTMLRTLIPEWPQQTLSPRAAQSFLRSMLEGFTEEAVADGWQPSLADRLRELIEFADGEEFANGERFPWVSIDSLRALLGEQA